MNDELLEAEIIALLNAEESVYIEIDLDEFYASKTLNEIESK